jgi:quinoprotein relay system zinc metallohydrolase 2
MHESSSAFRLLLGWLCLFAICPGLAQESLQTKEIAPGVFVHQGVHALPDRHNRGEIANVGYIVGERCVAIIDSGGSPGQGYALRRAVEATTKVPICYVINTHVHPDHIYGNIAFKHSGARFVGHHRLAQAMAMRALFYRERAARDLGFTLTAEHFIPPDVPVQQTLHLDLGGRMLTLTAHRTAHTDNDLSVYDTKTRILWLADLLFLGHVPVVDGSLNGWLEVIEQLRSWPARLVVPGHGPVSAEWPAALAPEKRYLEMLRNEIRAYIKQGKTMEDALAGVGLSAREDWQLFEEFHKRNVSTAFAELEWED